MKREREREIKRERACEEREKVTERDREKVRERLLRHIVLYCNHITSYHVILEDYVLFCFAFPYFRFSEASGASQQKS